MMLCVAITSLVEMTTKSNGHLSVEGYVSSSFFFPLLLIRFFIAFGFVLFSFSVRYSKLCKMVQKLVNILKQMDHSDPFRIEMTDALLNKL